jgi:hypothetical protein
LNADHQEQEIAKLKRQFSKKTQSEYIKLSIIGKGTCFGSDDTLRDRIILKKLQSKADQEENPNLKFKLRGRSYFCKVISSKLKVF